MKNLMHLSLFLVDIELVGMIATPRNLGGLFTSPWRFIGNFDRRKAGMPRDSYFLLFLRSKFDSGPRKESVPTSMMSLTPILHTEKDLDTGRY